MSVKLKVTMTWTFDVEPLWYDEADRTPERMAQIEQNQDDLESALSRGLNEPDFQYVVEVVK